MFSIIKDWIIPATLITFVALVVFGATQQSIRSSANDTPLLLASEAVLALESGSSVDSIISSQRSVDVSQSLWPFINIYNEEGKPLAGSGHLNSELPSPPQGVFDAARKHQENRLTWEPAKGVRQAIVVRHYSGKDSGFVVAGRSLEETEKREARLLGQVSLGWLVGLFLTLVEVIVLRRLGRA